jgi:hypothetical protein
VEKVKAIVAEIDKKQMIVITNKGDFVKIKRQMSAAIGDEIEFNARRSYLTYKRLASIAACFLACIFLSTGVYAYYTPYSYVSVDINPSIALSLNRFERVISVDPLSEDAAGFIKDTKDLKNQNIDNALSEIIKSASEKGYIDENTENQVMVVVSAKNSNQEKKLASAVNKAAVKELSKVNKSSEVTVEKTSVESYKTAISNKVSPGREILADKLREINPEIKDEEVRNMTVKEVVKLIKEGKKAEKAVEKDNKFEDKEKESEEDFQNKNHSNKKDDSEASNAEGKSKPSITGKDSKPKPTEANKDNKEIEASKDQENKEKANKDIKDNKDSDKDKDNNKNNDNNKDNNNDKEKDKEDKTDNDKGDNQNSKWNMKGKDNNKSNNFYDIESNFRNYKKPWRK